MKQQLANAFFFVRLSRLRFGRRAYAHHVIMWLAGLTEPNSFARRFVCRLPTLEGRRLGDCPKCGREREDR